MARIISIFHITTRVQEEDEYDEYLFKLNGTDIGLTSLRVNATMQEVSDAQDCMLIIPIKKHQKRKSKKLQPHMIILFLVRHMVLTRILTLWIIRKHQSRYVNHKLLLGKKKGSGLYGTTYNVIVPDGVDHKKMNLREVRAMHAYIIELHEQLGLQLNLKYLRKCNAINKDGNMRLIMICLLSVLKQKATKPLRVVSTQSNSKDLKDGSVKNVIRRLKANQEH